MEEKDMEEKDMENEEEEDNQMARMEVLDKRGVDKVFVYGSLMEGFWNHTRVLEGKVEILGRGEVKGNLYHLREGYPALLEGEDQVVGEVSGPVDEDLLRHLDYLEGYREGRKNNLYNRKAVDVRMADGSSVECWVYVYGDAEYARGRGTYLPDGDWRRHMAGQLV